MTFVGALLCLFLLVCLTRVGYLQFVEGSELLERGISQQKDSLSFYAKRGKVVDAEGTPLALTLETRQIEVVPSQVQDRGFVVEYLSGVLGWNAERVEKAAFCTSKPKVACYVHRVLDPKVVSALSEVMNPSNKDARARWLRSQLQGVRLIPAAARVYPAGERAGQLVGVARVPQCTPEKKKRGECKAPNPMELEGQYGVEADCNDVLAGRQIVQRGWKQNQAGVSLSADNPELELAGSTVQLSILLPIQAIAEEELARMVIGSFAKRGMALVMDVGTGELLAVAHYPPFNPNGTEEYAGSEIWKWNDAAFIEVFEPGSTIKPLVIAAILEEGLRSLDDSEFCENGSWKVDARHKPIKDHGAFGWLTLWDCIKFSSNICLGKLGLELGDDKLFEYMSRFGFGQKSGVKTSGREAKGMLSKGKRGWADMQTANVSFGQGLAVTAVQLVAAIAAIGNGGVLMKPILVKEIRDARGNPLVRYEPEVVRRVVAESVARQVIESMRRVLDRDGTGEKAVVYGYDAAGKTGTAQKVMTLQDPYWVKSAAKPKPALTSRYVDKWIASFVGLVPSDKPKLAILVLVDEPYSSHYGGVVAAPAFSRIAERALAYLNVVPTVERTHRIAPPPAGQVAKAAVPAEGPVLEASAAPASVGAAVVPDFAGMTPGEALRVAYAARVELIAEGSGVAISQTPAGKSAVAPWQEVKVQFSPAAGRNGR
jgi:cell division protein FtsI (penicillin-binding protein 3)